MTCPPDFTPVEKLAVWVNTTLGCLLLSLPLSAREPKLRATIAVQTAYFCSVAISPDGKTIAFSDSDGMIRLWDVATGKEQANLKASDCSVQVAFSPDGKKLASGTAGNRIDLWDLGTDKRTTLIDERKQCCGHTLLFSPDGKVLASGGWGDPEIMLWQVATGKKTAKLKGLDAYNVRAMAFMPDAKSLASLEDDGTIKLWEVATGKNTATMEIAFTVPSAAFSPDGKTLATATWDEERINGKDVVTDKTIKLWDVATGKILAPMKPAAKTDPAAISKLVRQLGSDDFSTREKTSKSLSNLDEVPAALGKAVKSTDAEVARRAQEAIRVITARLEKEGALEGHSELVRAMAFSPDGKTLASASEDKTIKLWDVATRKELATLTGHTDEVLILAYSADGKLLVSGSKDKTIKLWDLAKAK